MADVFISYTRADRPFVEQLAHVLGSSGVSVWFDRNLTVGEEYGREIEQELRAAGTCVVIWSAISVDRPWVRSEAQLGHNLGKLVPVMIEKCNIPLPFNGLHSYNLPRDAELSLQSPAVQAIREQVKHSTERVRGRRREVAVGAEDVKRWLIEQARSDPDSPGDFIEAHSVELEGPCFYPLLVGSIEWRGEVTASIGYDREEEYTEQEERKDATTNQTKMVPVKKKRTVTTWSPYAAPMSGNVDIALPGAPVQAALAKALVAFSKASAFLEEELPEEADVIESEANILTQPSNKGMIDSFIARSIESKLPGDRKKEVRFNATMNPSSTRIVYVPLWEGVVTYGGRKHGLIASGLESRDVLFEMPKDQALLADRDRRKSAGNVALGSGVVGAGIGAASLFETTSASVFAALAMTAVLAGIALAIWPFYDMHLGRQIRDREETNSVRRTRAVAALGLVSRSGTAVGEGPTKSGFRFSHGVALLAAIGSLGLGGAMIKLLLGL